MCMSRKVWLYLLRSHNVDRNICAASTRRWVGGAHAIFANVCGYSSIFVLFGSRCVSEHMIKCCCSLCHYCVVAVYACFDISVVLIVCLTEAACLLLNDRAKQLLPLLGRCSVSSSEDSVAKGSSFTFCAENSPTRGN